MDAVFECKDGIVKFSRGVLSSHSMIIKNINNEENIFLAKEFRCEAVRAIVKISHGCSEPVIIQDYSIWEEIKQLTTAISVRLNLEELEKKGTKRQCTAEVNSCPKRFKNFDHSSKKFTDWSRTGSRKKADRPPSYQKEKSTLIRIDYNKPNTKEHKIFENKTIDLVETNKKDIDEKDSEKKIKKEEEIDGQSLIKCSAGDTGIKVKEGNEHGNDELPSQVYCDTEKPSSFSEAEIEKIYSSYMIFETNQDGKVEYKCQLCQFFSLELSQVSDHVLLTHLNVYGYSCEFCNKKFKTRNDLKIHLQYVHTKELLDDSYTNEIKENDIDKQNENEDTYTKEVENAYRDQNEKRSHDSFPDVFDIGGTEELEVDTSVTRATVISDFESIIETKFTEDGSKKVFVKGASFPLLKHNHSTLEKIYNARFMKKEEALQTVTTSFLKNSQNNKYECILCQGKFKAEKISLIQNHMFKHFNIFIYRCGLCLDVFRTKNGLELHISNHELESSQSKQKLIGSYHLEGKEEFLPPDKAKPIIESYFIRIGNNFGSFECLVCKAAFSSYQKVYNHSLRAHLRIYCYSCEDCDKTFKYSGDFTKHKKEEHLHNVVKQYIENDFPELEDLSHIPIDMLKEKRINKIQEKSLRGRNFSFIVDSQQWECQLCTLKSQYKSTLQNHMYSVHYRVFTCVCSLCHQKFHNLNQLNVHRKSVHTNNKPKENENVDEVVVDKTVEYEKLTSPMYLGESKGKEVAKQYIVKDSDREVRRCRLCSFEQDSTIQLQQHILTKHLTNVFLYKCDECGKLFRNNKSIFLEHKLSHTQGKLPCPDCTINPLKSKKQPAMFSKRTLQNHIKTFHSHGSFICEGCGSSNEKQKEFSTKHELLIHQVNCDGKAESKMFACQICEYKFPTRSRLNKHAKRCEAGRSRTLFRKQISDILVYLGKGSYQCNFCSQQFHPHPNDPLKAGLPKARNHVVTKHGMRHMRKLKMQWLGDPASVDKSQVYKDRSSIWFQKLKDIEKAHTSADIIENMTQSEDETGGKDGTLAASYKSLLDALSQTNNTSTNKSRTRKAETNEVTDIANTPIQIENIIIGGEEDYNTLKCVAVVENPSVEIDEQIHQNIQLSQVEVVHDIQVEQNVHHEGQGIGHQIVEPVVGHHSDVHDGIVHQEIESVIFHVIQDTQEDI